MYLEKLVKTKTLKYLTTAVIIVAFGFLSFQRTKVWRDSDVLWTDVIKHYPDAALPRGNRSNHLIRLSNDPEYKAQSAAMLQKALEDCNVALKNKPNYGKCYENRQTIYLTRKEYSLALADANSLIKYEPNNRFGYYTKGVVGFSSAKL
jgi:tetratricopeptide (TPR) repeat protein